MVKQFKDKVLRYLRLDRSGDNLKLARELKKLYPTLICEFTAKDTPQQNGKLERAIATIWNRVRAMMDGAGIKGILKNKLWAEAFRTAIMWHNISLTSREPKCPNLQWGEDLPHWIKTLRIFGEIEVVKKNGILNKLSNNGYDCMMIGYEEISARGLWIINRKSFSSKRYNMDEYEI